MEFKYQFRLQEYALKFCDSFSEYFSTDFLEMIWFEVIYYTYKMCSCFSFLNVNWYSINLTFDSNDNIF